MAASRIPNRCRIASRARCGSARPVHRFGNSESGDQIIHPRQQCFKIAVHGVQIRRDRNSVTPRDLRRVRNGGGIVPIHVQQPRAHDLLLPNLFRFQRKTLRTVPEDGALACRFVHNNVGRLVRTILAQPQIADIHSGFAQAFKLNSAPLIVADRADVFRPKPQPGTGHHRACDLPARRIPLGLKRRFAAGSRKLADLNDRIGRVQADSHNIEFRHLPAA